MTTTATTYRCLFRSALYAENEESAESLNMRGIMAKTGVLTVALAIARPGVAGDNDLESWYMLWGVGMASNRYTELVHSQLHEEGLDFRSRSPADRLGMAFDAFGLYWPLGKKTLIGGVINGSHDVFHRQRGHCVTLLNYL